MKQCNNNSYNYAINIHSLLRRAVHYSSRCNPAIPALALGAVVASATPQQLIPFEVDPADPNGTMQHAVKDLRKTALARNLNCPDSRKITFKIKGQCWPLFFLT